MTTKYLVGTGGDGVNSFNTWPALLATIDNTTLAAPLNVECSNFSHDAPITVPSTVVTSAANYLRIYPAAGAAHTGIPRAQSGSGFRINDNSAGAALTISASYVRVENIEVYQAGAGSALRITGLPAVSSDIRTSACLVHDVATGSGITCDVAASNLTLTANNMTVFGNQRSMDTRGAVSVTANNCTLHRFQDAYGILSSGELSLNNCASTKSTGSSPDIFTTSTIAGSHNASSDGTAATLFGAGSIGSVSPAAVFVSPTQAAPDFRLTAGTNALVDAGAAVSGLTVDAIGTARPQGTAYDIGAFERAVATGGSTSGATLTGTGTLSPGAASGTTPAGTLTTLPLKNNTATAWASQTGVTLNIYNATTGALVLQKTGLATDASGVLTVTDPALAAGTTYAYEPVFPGGARRLPTKAAA